MTQKVFSYQAYKYETELAHIKALMDIDLSEPYSVFTYRYFINNWPELCLVKTPWKFEQQVPLYLHTFRYQCYDGDTMIGAIVCKCDAHKTGTFRGYIAMIAVHKEYRKMGIGSQLVINAIEEMKKKGCDEIVLETEVTNTGALALYKKLGFLRDKRMHTYYLNGGDAFRLKLFLEKN